MAAYSASATYNSDDLDDIAIDGIGGLGVSFVAFASLVGLTLIYVWFKKRL